MAFWDAINTSTSSFNTGRYKRKVTRQDILGHIKQIPIPPIKEQLKKLGVLRVDNSIFLTT